MESISSNSRKDWIKQLLAILNNGLYEREEFIAICLLGFLTGQNIFLLGPPGTGKSMISRRLSKIVEGAKYFEYLMQKFSTPEDLFGPVSISGLKEDKYLRKINGYLPDAEVVFLDEIWKANPAILNALLTAINEKLYKNDGQMINIPLKSLITASNEYPGEDSGLDALYDRFTLRAYVPELRDEYNFKSLLNSSDCSIQFNIPTELQLSFKQIEEWQKEIHTVKITDEIMSAVMSIRKKISQRFSHGQNLNQNYVSDRRWQRIAYLLKASAYFNNRLETNYSDLYILNYSLWNTPDNIEYITQLIDTYISKTKTKETNKLSQIIKKNHEICYNECTYVSNEFVKGTKEIDGKYCHEISIEYNDLQTIAYVSEWDEQHTGNYDVYLDDGCVISNNAKYINSGKILQVHIISRTGEMIEYSKSIPYAHAAGSTKPISMEKASEFVNMYNHAYSSFIDFIDNAEILGNIFIPMTKIQEYISKNEELSNVKADLNEFQALIQPMIKYAEGISQATQAYAELEN